MFYKPIRMTNSVNVVQCWPLFRYFIIFISTIISEITAKEFCHNEQFIASCPEGEVVVMTGAQYGRMQIGSCVKTGFGFLGCYVDAIAHAHERCSGRPTCSIRVPDAGLDKTRPCNDDLKSYLDANFTCVKVATHEDCVASTSESLDQQQYVYLSNRDFPNTSGKTCGSVESRWTIRALPGQRINVTLIDFSSVRLQSTMIRDSLSLKPTQTSVSEQCDRYAVIHTRSSDGSEATSAAGKAFVVCGNQKREWPSTHVYTSANNIISVEITKRNEPSYNFLLKFEAIGCPKLDSPGNIRLKITGSGAAVHCIDSGDVWYLTCDGTRWNGTLDNCTAVSPQDAPRNTRFHSISFGAGMLVVLVVSLSIGVCVLLLGVFYIKSKHVERIIGREELSLRDLKPLGSPDAIYEITTQDVYARNKAFELMTSSKMNIKRSAIGKTRPTETESNLGLYVWESPSTSRARTMGVKVVVKSDTDSGKTSITTAPYSAPRHMRTATVVALPAKDRIETGLN